MQVQLKGLKFNLLICALLSAVLGMLISFSLGPTFMLGLILSIFLFLRYSKCQDRRFISFLFLAAVASRILIVYFLHILLSHYGFREADFFGDGGDNSYRGWELTRFWAGSMAYYYTAAIDPYNMHGWTYFISFFYSLFGHSILALKFFNCLIGSLTAVVIYFMVKEISTAKAARLSAVLVAFFPSMFLWSLSNLKEPVVIFLISVILWSFTILWKKKKLYYLIFLILALWFLITVRTRIGFCIIITVLFSYFCALKLSLIKKIAICLIAIIALQGFLTLKNRSFQTIVSEQLADILILHRGVVATGGSVYKVLDEKYYRVMDERDIMAEMNLKDYTMMLLRGWGHFLFEPFPWKIATKQALLSYPQMILWYALTPFAILGLLLLLKYRLKESIILVIFFLVFTSTLAIVGGNIGTDFRRRDMLTPVFLVFASTGLVSIFSHNCKLKLTKKDENFSRLSATV